MRLIDADALQRALAQMWYDSQISITGISVSELIHKQPSIDIVRCGECKYWKSTVQMPNGTEVKCLYGRKADDFCSYGEQFGKTEQLKGVGKADRFGKE